MLPKKLQQTLCKRCPNTELFLVCVFPYSVQIRENIDQKKLRIWILFTQWYTLDSVLYTPMRTVWKILEYLTGTAEAYLEPSQTTTMKLFCENSQRLKAVDYFSKKSFVVEVPLGSKYASALNKENNENYRNNLRIYYSVFRTLLSICCRYFLQK